MRFFSSFALMALALPATSQPVPVLVELFTSEGCSSCPAADELLVRLREQPVPGVLAIPLSQHVDYWDRLGWKDPFSSSLFTYRQRIYADHFRTRGPYTPQMVVDGITEFVGSDARRLGIALKDSARQPKIDVGLAVDGDKLTVRIGQVPTGVADRPEVLLAIAENNLFTQVPRGENEGRKLRHDGVTRSLEVLGKAAASVIPSFNVEKSLKLESSWKRTDLRAVVFVQDRKTRRVLGVSSVAISQAE